MSCVDEILKVSSLCSFSQLYWKYNHCQGGGRTLQLSEPVQVQVVTGGLGLGQTGSRAGHWVLCCAQHLLQILPALFLLPDNQNYISSSKIQFLMPIFQIAVNALLHFPSLLPGLFSQVLLPLLWSPVLCLLSQKDQKIPLEHFHGLLFPVTFSTAGALEKLWDNTRHFAAAAFWFFFPFFLKLYRLPFLRILLPTHSERIRLWLALQVIFRPTKLIDLCLAACYCDITLSLLLGSNLTFRFTCKIFGARLGN